MSPPTSKTKLRLGLALLAAIALAGAGTFGLAALAGVGCLDVTPITVAPNESGVPADAGCYKCINQPENCSDTVAVCKADEPGCGQILACIEVLACFDRPTIDQKVTCGLPCVLEAGVTAIADPRVDRLLAVLRCGQTKCGVACNLGDGGIPFDAL